MLIFDELKKEHDVQRDLIDQLCSTSGESKEREQILSRLKKQMETHADAEERYFYVPLFDDSMSQDKARHSVAEHKELDDHVETLESTPMNSSAWLSHAKKLKERLIHHLDEEEHEIFQIAGKVLADSEKEDLGVAYRKHMNEWK